MRRVFHTIRVPDLRFRRETPEIQQAIAALEHGENIMIFPEGWLKRNPEQTVRRFGQGVYQILREKPRTPVVVCWIEGGWGSYTSFWNGPPTKGKKLDFFRRIRIGIAEPEVLSLEVLSDRIQTRRHLMQACLHARTYLGLPELPAPPFAADSEAEEEDGGNGQTQDSTSDSDTAAQPPPPPPETGGGRGRLSGGVKAPAGKFIRLAFIPKTKPPRRRIESPKLAKSHRRNN